MGKRENSRSRIFCSKTVRPLLTKLGGELHNYPQNILTYNYIGRPDGGAITARLTFRLITREP